MYEPVLGRDAVFFGAGLALASLSEVDDLGHTVLQDFRIKCRCASARSPLSFKSDEHGDDKSREHQDVE